MSAASLISSTKGLLSRLRLGQKQREDKTYAQLVAAGSISDALHQGRLNELDLGLDLPKDEEPPPQRTVGDLIQQGHAAKRQLRSLLLQSNTYLRDFEKLTASGVARDCLSELGDTELHGSRLSSVQQTDDGTKACLPSLQEPDVKDHQGAFQLPGAASHSQDMITRPRPSPLQVISSNTAAINTILGPAPVGTKAMRRRSCLAPSPAASASQQALPSRLCSESSSNTSDSNPNSSNGMSFDPVPERACYSLQSGAQPNRALRRRASKTMLVPLPNFPVPVSSAGIGYPTWMPSPLPSPLALPLPDAHAGGSGREMVYFSATGMMLVDEGDACTSPQAPSANTSLCSLASLDNSYQDSSTHHRTALSPVKFLSASGIHAGQAGAEKWDRLQRNLSFISSSAEQGQGLRQHTVIPAVTSPSPVPMHAPDPRHGPSGPHARLKCVAMDHLSPQTPTNAGSPLPQYPVKARAASTTATVVPGPRQSFEGPSIADAAAAMSAAMGGRGLPSPVPPTSLPKSYSVRRRSTLLAVAGQSLASPTMGSGLSSHTHRVSAMKVVGQDPAAGDSLGFETESAMMEIQKHLAAATGISPTAVQAADDAFMAEVENLLSDIFQPGAHAPSWDLVQSNEGSPP